MWCCDTVFILYWSSTYSESETIFSSLSNVVGNLGLDKDLFWIQLSGEASFLPMVTWRCESNKPDVLINAVLGDV